MDRDEADEILIPHLLWSEDEADMHLEQELKRQAKKRKRRRCAEKISMMMNPMTMPMTTAFVVIWNRYH